MSNAVVDRENIHARPALPRMLRKEPSLRRPALDELSNKVAGLKKPTKPSTKADPFKAGPVLHELSNKVAGLKEPTTKAGPSKAATKKAESSKVSVTLCKQDLFPGKELNPAKSYSSQQFETAINVSVDSGDDPQLVSEYAQDIYTYLLEMERKFPIKETFLDNSATRPRMRAVLINWLAQVHASFGMCPETLYMSVSLLDRYIQDRRDIGKETLQLVGITALYVAGKYEEMYLPELGDFVYVCDESFSQRQILKAEIDMLMTLNCSLGKPLSVHFLRRYSRIALVRQEQHNLAKYVLELALLDHKLASIRPSKQAAAACFVSITVLTNNVGSPSKVWTPTLVHYSGYKFSDFKSVVVSFANMLLNVDSLKLRYIQTKYSDVKYHKISLNSKLKGYVVKKLAEPVNCINVTSTKIY